MFLKVKPVTFPTLGNRCHNGIYGGFAGGFWRAAKHKMLICSVPSRAAVPDVMLPSLKDRLTLIIQKPISFLGSTAAVVNRAAYQLQPKPRTHQLCSVEWNHSR